MIKLILFELLLLFLATTFKSDSTGGWIQQTLPVNKFVNDIYFTDSLTGWCVTTGGTSSTDTGYVMKTINGGTNWLIQYQESIKFYAIQFTDINTGFTVGSNTSGFSFVYKTTNSGINWFIASSLFLGPLTDLNFVNKDTGWVCEDDLFDPSVLKTTDGGVSWQGQLSQSFHIIKLFFINKDTGWAGSSGSNGKLYRTTNGGTNWNLQFTFTQQINDIYFFNKLVGIVSSGFSYKSTDGGFNWILTNDGGIKLSFANDSIGWAGSTFSKVMKSTTGGRSWVRQTSPIFDNPSSFAIDTLKAWAGGTGLIYTSDGGGPPVGIQQISSEIPKEYKLFQNYPNPFNPKTVISYQLRVNSYTKVMVYDISGREITTLANQKQNAGTYQVDFDASNLPSGVYFYQLIITNEQSTQIFKETKKMLLIK